MHPEFSDFEALLFSLGYCAFMLVLSIIFYKFPPKKINNFYGYRTFRSKKNQDVWTASNTYWALLFLKLNIVTFAIPVIIYLSYPQQTIISTIIGSTILLLATIPVTEVYLNKNFDKDGNRI